LSSLRRYWPLPDLRTKAHVRRVADPSPPNRRQPIGRSEERLLTLTYAVGDEVLRRGQHGIERGRVTAVVNGFLRNKKALHYQVRVGMLTHLNVEQDLRPARRR
jgi:hypothetical protein